MSTKGTVRQVTEKTAAAATGATRRPPVGVVIAVLLVSTFIVFLNETIMSVGLRHLSIDLNVSTASIQWLTSGFLVTMAVVIPTTGFLLDRFTPRAIFLAAMGMFCLGTLVGALAPAFLTLLLGRVLQACGTALMVPLVGTTVMRLVAPDKRGATMGLVSTIIAFAPALGPTIGGATLAFLGWRWMFYLMLPFVVLALIVGAATIRVESETRAVRLDVVSVLLSALAFGGILYGFSSIAQTVKYLPPWIPIVIGAVVLILFVLRQRSLQRAERALLDLRPFTRQRFSVALVLSALLFMVYIGVGSVLLPLYLQTVLHQNTFVTGLMVLPGGLALGIVGVSVGRLFDRYGARPLIVPGAVAMTVALWTFAALGEGAPLGLVIAVHIVLMVGIGLIVTPLMAEPLSALPASLYGHGAAILTASQQLAGAFGTAIFVTVAALGAANVAGTPDLSGMRLAFVIAGVTGVLAIVCSLFTRKRASDVAADPSESATKRAASE